MDEFPGKRAALVAGTSRACSAIMTVAMPVWRNRVSPLLDTATRLLVLTCRDGVETSRRVLRLEAVSPGELAGLLASLRLDQLLCGALSGELARDLKQRGVRVRPHLCGELEEILQAFCHGQLGQRRFRIPGCRQAHPLPKTCGPRPGRGSVPPKPPEVQPG